MVSGPSHPRLEHPATRQGPQVRTPEKALLVLLFIEIPRTPLHLLQRVPRSTGGVIDPYASNHRLECYGRRQSNRELELTGMKYHTVPPPVQPNRTRRLIGAVFRIPDLGVEHIHRVPLETTCRRMTREQLRQ